MITMFHIETMVLLIIVSFPKKTKIVAYAVIVIYPVNGNEDRGLATGTKPQWE